MPVPTLLGKLPQLLGVPFPFRIDSPDSFQSAAIPLRRTVRRSDGQTARKTHPNWAFTFRIVVEYYSQCAEFQGKQTFLCATSAKFEMVFNSYTFIAFFIAIFIFMRFNASWTNKKLVLLLASYLFYAAWNPPFVILIWISTLVDWFIARAIAASDSQSKRRYLVVLTLIVNLGLLGFFKYGNFILENFIFLANNIGIQYAPAQLDIVLPVGISFYTFQTLSYTLDVYRGHLEPSKSFLDYALFVTFFPQLVAGPIVRAADFLPQTTQETKPTNSQVAWGMSLVILGLFQKVVIADGLLAPIAEKVFDSEQIPSLITTGVGTLAFAGQIFCDFAGYSTIAIGVAACLGFALPDNFRFPYAAIGFSDFWRRWHVSLSSWLRDYLYISLGGNRGTKFQTYRNLMMTMFLGGLWHGASWNFAIWGVLHGLYLVMERLSVSMFGNKQVWKKAFSKLLLGAVTFSFVCFAWIFFRADTLSRSFEMLSGISLPGTGELYVNRSDAIIVLIVMSTIIVIQSLLRNTTLEDAAKRLPDFVKILIIAVMVLGIMISPGEDRAFIYFQF